MNREVRKAIERAVWERLRAKRQGVKFRRDKLSWRQPLSFWCPELMLEVEVDCGGDIPGIQRYGAYRIRLEWQDVAMREAETIGEMTRKIQERKAVRPLSVVREMESA